MNGHDPWGLPIHKIQDPPAKRRFWRRRAVWGGIGALILLLVPARLALPAYLRSYVNRVLDESPDYGGSVGAVDVNLWRGAYTVHDVEVVKKGHAVPVPFFEGPRVDCSLDWRALLHGVARGKIRMEQPRLHFVHGPSPEQTQTGVDQPWLSMINDLFPFRIDRAEILDGEIHFHAFHMNPQVHIHLTGVQASIENLTNVEDKTDPLMAQVHATGDAMETGRFEFDMSLDPQSHRPRFDLATKLLDLDVTRLNSLARAYGDFDFEGGHFDLVVEMTTQDGFLRGYSKPLFRNVTVVGVRDLNKGDPLQLLWEGLVGIVGAVFKNQDRDQFGTLIEFEGDLDNPRTNLLDIVGNVLRNAFIRAYLPRVDGRVAPAASKQIEGESDE